MARILALRFGVVFGALLVFPFPLAQLPVVGEPIEHAVGVAWSWLDTHVGALFGLEVARHPTGSGDTLADFVQLAICIAIAAVVAAAWTARARGTLEHPRVAAWGRVVLRYYLAATMLSYGLAKVFPGQFGHAEDTNLYAQIGHKSPMGILWTFMAVSRPYQVFGGMMECVGGVLLIWRRTTLLGALVLLPVVTTVVALNFCYDVPVKLFSSELLLGVIVLLLPDARRLLAAVFARTDPDWPRWRRARSIGKFVAIAAYIAFSAYQISGVGDDDDDAKTLFGVWDVARFVRDGTELPPGVPDATRWKVLAVRSTAMLRTADGEDHFHRVTRNNDRLELGDAGAEGAFAVVFHGDEPTLTGTYEGHALVVELRRTDPMQMPLIARGFHWIQEYPYNR